MTLNPDDRGMLLAIANEFLPGQRVTHNSLNRMINMVYHKSNEAEAIAERNGMNTDEIVEFVRKELDD